MNHHWKLGLSTATVWLLWIVTAPIASGKEISYTDANGQVWTRNDENGPAKFVIDAYGAMALYNMGLGSSSGQVVAIYNQWVAGDQEYDFEADQPGDSQVNPSTEEIQFLRSVPIDLTPTCQTTTSNCNWGTLLDYDTLDSLEYDFLIETTNIGRGNSFEEQNRTAIVYHNRFSACGGAHQAYERDGCVRRSAIDDVLEWEYLAEFLGIAHTPQSIQHKQAMCQTAAEFVEYTKSLHDKGIYVVVADYSAFNGGQLIWRSPAWNRWTRTLEELGMPLVHPPNSSETVAVAQNEWDYPVDIWLFQGELLRYFLNFHDDVAGEFPNPAFVQKQYSQFPHELVPTYRLIAGWLQQLMDDTKDMVRVHDKALQCVDADVTNADHPSLNGTFVCYNESNFQTLYLECPEDPITPAPTPTPGGLCFSSHNQVQLENGQVKQMRELKLGDFVLTMEGYESVYSWSHLNPTKQSTFIKILPCGVELSANHMLFLQDGRAIPAQMIQVGDVLYSGEEVQQIKHVMRHGVYAPFTASGTIVVNGQVASTFISLQETSDVLLLNQWPTGLSHQWLAHTFELPHRMWCSSRNNCKEESYTADGVSTWVSIPLVFFQWFLSQSGFTQLVLGIPILCIFGFIGLLGLVMEQPVGIIFVASLSAIGVLRNSGKK